MPKPNQRYAPGTQLGPFTVVAFLGQGAMGIVLHVRDDAQRDLALKLFNLPSGSARSLERFRREAEVAGSLRHSGLVSVHDQGNLGEQAYISYELVQGGRTLEDLLDTAAPDVLLKLVQEAAEAVGHAHAQGVIHRDLKPANILVDEAGHARVTDFGLAYAIGLERLTRTGAMIGTPAAMSPEQVAGKRDSFGPPTDVWALGALLYRVLAGQDPFEADSLPQLAARVVSAEPIAPRVLNPDAEPSVEAVCLKALSKRPEDRYSDAGAFAEALQTARTGEGAPVSSASSRALLVLALLLACGGVLGATALYWTSASSHAEPHSEQGLPTPPTAVVQDLDPAREAARAQLRRILGERGPKAGQRVVDGLRGLSPTVVGDDPDCVQLLKQAQGDWVADLERLDSDADPSVAAVRAQEEPLRVLAALHRLLPVGSRPFPGRGDLANRLVRQVGFLGGRENYIGLALLEALADLEARVTDPVVASDVFELWSSAIPINLRIGGTNQNEITRVLVAAAKLDIGFCKGLYLRGGRDLGELMERSDDPWFPYVQSRLSGRSRLQEDVLDSTWRKRPEGLILGPVHEAELACLIADHSEVPSERVTILEPMVDLADGRPLFCLEFAKALSDVGRHDDALRFAETALTNYEASGLNTRFHATRQRESLLLTLTTLFAAAGKRSRAQGYYEEWLEFEEPGEEGRDAELRTTFPWLENPR